MSGSVRQWIRKISLITAPTETSEGLELSDLHVVFTVTAMVSTTPATLTARIYNLSDETSRKLLKDLPTSPEPSIVGAIAGAGKIALRAGYEGNFGIIFKGDVMQVKLGRETATDSFVEIFAADGDWGHVWGRINTTLAAGWKPSDVNDETRKALTAYGMTVDQLPDVVPQRAAPRGKVLFGRARDIQRDMGRGLYTDTYTRQGNVEWLPAAAFRPGDVVKITGRTGMIGFPQQTNQGVQVRMLLNPSVGHGTQLWIDDKSIQRQTLSATVGEDTLLTNQILLGNLSAQNDGIYKVLFASHTGDTRGNDWYTDVFCMALEQRGPIKAVQPPGYWGYDHY